jgi:hypothetical protein
MIVTVPSLSGISLNNNHGVLLVICAATGTSHLSVSVEIIAAGVQVFASGRAVIHERRGLLGTPSKKPLQAARIVSLAEARLSCVTSCHPCGRIAREREQQQVQAFRSGPMLWCILATDLWRVHLQPPLRPRRLQLHPQAQQAWCGGAQKTEAATLADPLCP